MNLPSFKIKSLKNKLYKILHKRFPIFRWLPNYKLSYLSPDTIAGLTIGLMVVPQSMAFAAIAGLSPEYGLYSSYISSFLYVLLGNCPQMTIGPTSLVALMSFETCGDNFPSCHILAGFYAGIIEILLVILRLGWVINFISEPVTVGFTAGAAFTTISSQLKNFFGMKGQKGSKFLGYWDYVIKDVSSISLYDSIFGISAFIGLLLIKKLGEINTNNGKLNGFLKIISTSRNILVLIITSVVAFIFHPNINLTGDITGGFPQIEPPNFILSNPSNETSNEFLEKETVFGSLSYLSSGPFVIALISILQNVSVLKGFGRSEGTDANQEILALGICNTVGSFFNSIPTCGSFSRSAVNNASGVKTPLNGIFTGILVIISIQFLTPTFYYIPKASLAAVIIMALISLIRFQDILPMWRISKIDFFISLITFLASLLLGMEYGIGIGTGLNVVLLIFKITRPSIGIVEQDGIIIITPDALDYPSFDRFFESARKLDNEKKIILDLKRCTKVDFSIALGMNTLVKDGNNISFVNVSNEAKIAFLNAGVSIDYFVDSAVSNRNNTVLEIKPE